MIVSKNFLKEFLPKIDEHEGWINRVIEAIEKSGAEVERWEKINPPTGLFYGIIKRVEKVKESNSLNLCNVFVPFSRKKNNYSIVCGASNVRENLRVIVALPGAKLGDFEIGRRRFEKFGIESEGMICAYRELYKSEIIKTFIDSNEGIIEIWDKEKIDRAFVPKDLGLDDVIFEITVPNNRPDLSHVWGLAQEIRKNLLMWDDLGLMMKAPKPYVHRLEEFLEDYTGYDSKWENPWDLKKLLLTCGAPCHRELFKNLIEYFRIALNDSYLDGFHSWQMNGTSDKILASIRRYILSSWLPMTEIEIREQIKNLPSNWINLNWNSILDFLNLKPEFADYLIEKLEKFGYSFQHENKCQTPFWRTDIKNQRDLEEELLRIIDVEKDIEEIPACFSYQNNESNESILKIEKIREFWKNNHFFECTTFNLRPKSGNQEYSVEVINPVSEDHVVYRQNALQDLIEVIGRNVSVKEKLHPVFELVEIDKKWKLNVVVPDDYWDFNMSYTMVNNDLFDLRALIKRTQRILNNNIVFVNCEDSIDGFIGTNLLSILDSSTGNSIGYLGFLESKLPIKLWGFVMDLELNPYKTKHNKSFEFSKFPPSSRDISIEILSDSKEKKIGAIIDSFTSSLNKEGKERLLRDVNVVERYETKDVVSYTLSLKFQSNSRTLCKKDLDVCMNAIHRFLEDDLKLKIR